MQKSLLGKKWNLNQLDDNLSVFQNILRNRSLVTSDEVNNFISPSYKKGFHNPFLLKDMDKAVARIREAIIAQERIIVFGDYDVDGISGTAILVTTLQKLGANVSYRLPHRVNDGYGLNLKFIEEFKTKGIKVLITVDCGISCREQISVAKEAGIDVIITDHHTIPEQIPDQAYAILHPKQPDCTYPFKGLTGSGVAFKLASALITDHLAAEERDKFMYSILDLASLGTVADLGPLIGENRIIVRYGLEALQKTNWQGLAYLMESAGIDVSQKLDVSTIGFKIGPRINAAGRIDHPYYALQMLLHEGDEKRGRELADKLEKLNQERQQMVQTALEEAFSLYNQGHELKKIYIGWSPDWHVGILGLIASKMVEKFHLPAIAMQEFEEHLVGSFRSVEQVNAVDALNFASEYLEHFGGHAQAAGFNLKKSNLPGFILKLNEFVNVAIQNLSELKLLNLDADLSNFEITAAFLQQLTLLEPYGMGNERPVFLLRGARIEDLKKVGKEQQHLHFSAYNGKDRFSAIAFKLGHLAELVRTASFWDLAFHLEKNIWNGKESIQLQVIDLRPV